MKKIMIIFLLLISNLTNAEVFTIVGNANLRGTVLTLVEGERYVTKQALRKHSSTSDWTDDYIVGYVTFGDATYVMELRDNYVYGPCSINLNHSNNDNCHFMVYEITNLNDTDDSSTSDSKYTVSLNNDGTRLAIGEQQGTNTSTRVYEYDDVTEAWEQLGDSVE